jgi:hypothetical protein
MSLGQAYSVDTSGIDTSQVPVSTPSVQTTNSVLLNSSSLDLSNLPVTSPDIWAGYTVADPSENATSGSSTSSTSFMYLGGAVLFAIAIFVMIGAKK